MEKSFSDIKEEANGMDLPLGLSRQLAMDAQASDRFYSLAKTAQADIIRYVQTENGIEDAKTRIEKVLDSLKNNRNQ